MNAYIERIETAIKELRSGKMIILTDHPDRENEGDIIFPAESITPEVVNFMIRQGSGIVCLALLSEQLKKLGLSLMVPLPENTSSKGTPFTVSIEAAKDVTTGVSAKDRATTILAAANPSATSSDIVKPGHIFPLQAQEGGVLTRQGHTEGSIDIVRLAGFHPAAVICEIMNPDGTMASGKDLQDFALRHQLCLLSIDDIIQYRLSTENLIQEDVSTEIPLENFGTFTLSVIKEKFNPVEHIILTAPSKSDSPTLVRIHSSCVTGDLFGSQRCDCNNQLNYSLQKIQEEGGILLYLNQEGRGIGLFNKIKAYALQETGLDTVEANTALNLPIDCREYSIAANILRNKGIDNIRLLTNNPLKVAGLQKYGLHNIKMENLPVFCHQKNKNYLKTKKKS